MRIIPSIIMFAALIVPGVAGAALQEHLVTLPILESAQFTCTWWSATKGKAERKSVEGIASAFMEGLNAGKSGRTRLYFVDGSKMRWVTEAASAVTLGSIDDYCRKFSGAPWTNALLLTDQKDGAGQ